MRRDALLWTLLLAPPLAWGAHLQAAYALHQQTCASRNFLMIYAVSAVMLLVVAVCAWQARRLTMTIDLDPPTRERFMATCAFLGALFFALVIVGQTIPAVMLRPCD